MNDPSAPVGGSIGSGWAADCGQGLSGILP